MRPSLSWDTPDTYLSLSGIGHMWGSVNSCCFKVTQRGKPLGLWVQTRVNGQAEAGAMSRVPVAMAVTALETPAHPGVGDICKGARECPWSSTPLTSTG